MIDGLIFSHCEDAVQLGAALEKYSASLGVPLFSYFLVKGRDDPEPFFLSNYRQSWLDRYLLKSYQHYDPVIVTSLNARLPFFWNQNAFLTPFQKVQKRVFFEAREFNIGSGYSVPVRGPNNDLGVFSIAAANDNDLVDAIRVKGSSILSTAMQAHDRAMVLSADALQSQARPVLSPREIECLKWTADGKTTDEIASRIGLSAATVNYHLAKVTAKLSAANRHHAAIIALRMKYM